MAVKEIHLRDYFNVIYRNDFIVITSFLLIFGSALIVSLYMPRVYEATATIEVQPSAQSSGLSSLMQSVMSRGSDQVSMETICKRFTSYTLLDETIRNLKRRSLSAYGDLSPESLASKIQAEAVPDTRMIEIKVKMRMDEGGSQRAVKIANELACVMQAQRGAKTDAETLRRQDFIDNKIKAIESQIGNSDQNIRQLLKSKGNSLMWSAHIGNIFTQLSSLTVLKETNEALLSAEQKKLSEIKSRLNSEPEFIEYSRTFSQDALWGKYRIDLADLNQKYAAAKVELGEENSRVKSTRAQINEIEEKMKMLASEVMSAKTESINPTYQSLLSQVVESEMNVITYTAQRDIAVKMLSDLNREKERIFSEMPESQFQLDKIEREVGYRVDAYKSLLEKKLEAEILATENSGDNYKVKGGIEIVDLARPESRPVSPRIKFIGIIASLVGLSVGLALAFLGQYFNNTYQSAEEAKDDLDIPILGMIPFVKNQQNSIPALPVLKSPMSAEAESFRILVTNIELSGSAVPRKMLLITSSIFGEGKSFVAANLALAIAQTRKQVILVDCNMRKPIQHKIFDVNSRIGLTNMITENAKLESALQDTNVPDLRLLCCGTVPSNPLELLRSKKLDDILAELNNICDVLIFDCLPVLPVADSLILASKLDGMLFLADLNGTNREAVKRTRERLSRLDVPLLGLICNKVDTAKSDSYHYNQSAHKQRRSIR